jgi:hypothetical protein
MVKKVAAVAASGVCLFTIIAMIGMFLWNPGISAPEIAGFIMMSTSRCNTLAYKNYTSHNDCMKECSANPNCTAIQYDGPDYSDGKPCHVYNTLYV